MTDEMIAEIDAEIGKIEARRALAIEAMEGGLVVSFLAGYVKGMRAVRKLVAERAEVGTTAHLSHKCPLRADICDAGDKGMAPSKLIGGLIEAYDFYEQQLVSCGSGSPDGHSPAETEHYRAEMESLVKAAKDLLRAKRARQRFGADVMTLQERVIRWEMYKLKRRSGTAEGRTDG